MRDEGSILKEKKSLRSGPPPTPKVQHHKQGVSLEKGYFYF